MLDYVVYVRYRVSQKDASLSKPKKIIPISVDKEGNKMFTLNISAIGFFLELGAMQY